ncbi:MAG: FAD-binding oxidoreductase [Deltaproteobacteria bacterium]|nr:FAD-binding oxidoreductase [Deltaproteobacteria bacterium]
MKLPGYEVAIVGEGITGLSTAFHLRKHGVKVITVSHPRRAAYSQSSAGLLAGGMADNFSRFSHAHGLDFAKELWTFANRGFDDVVTFAKEHKVPFVQNRRLRLIVSEAENREAEIAVDQMNKVGLSGKLVKASQSTFFHGLSSRVLSVQDDGEKGAWIDTEALTGALRTADAFRMEKPLHSFAKGSDGKLDLEFSDGSSIRSEILVLACHDHIGHFLPQLSDALVTFADQWSEVEVPQLDEGAGIVFSANHGHEWGLLLPHKIHVGGGRYMRKLAGIGALEPQEIPEIAKHLREQLSKTFDWAQNTELKKTTPLLDIWPCDELPVIGPMFGESRVFLATGYMSSGLSLGFEAGRCLSELILKGKSERLPRRLYPERLRSL